ncbi:MAG: pyridinium-3,5-biscarboxylic acid mononucleotide sulfurtransferase [Eubacteriaceae bacterium]|nr:pyridinium-3,5-biscarboxylic acid mononucleotide sulfurtransferase [Eubacteriaceae bacterium]
MNNQTTNNNLNEKLKTLKEIIAAQEKVCIAFSGGVDSTLLLKVATDTAGVEVLPILANGAMMPRSEFEEALEIAQSMGLEAKVIEANIFLVPQFAKNGQDRCYHCKKFLFEQIQKAALDAGFSTILDGSNLDDEKDYRPGIRALGELGILSPLKMAQLTKDDIRNLSAHYRLKTAKKPAMACLATRIPTDSPITPHALQMVEAGEEVLKSLDLKQYRLRLIGKLGKIECDPEDFDTILKNRNILTTKLKKIGFASLALDLSGYQQGKMNTNHS